MLDINMPDINMPDMNGYDVCRQLETDERIRDIPVIFLSALDEGLFSSVRPTSCAPSDLSTFTHGGGLLGSRKEW